MTTFLLALGLTGALFLVGVGMMLYGAYRVGRERADH